VIRSRAGVAEVTAAGMRWRNAPAQPRRTFAPASIAGIWNIISTLGIIDTWNTVNIWAIIDTWNTINTWDTMTIWAITGSTLLDNAPSPRILSLPRNPSRFAGRRLSWKNLEVDRKLSSLGVAYFGTFSGLGCALGEPRTLGEDGEDGEFFCDRAQARGDYGEPRF
jgi:hypothetical protein